MNQLPQWQCDFLEKLKDAKPEHSKKFDAQFRSVCPICDGKTLITSFSDRKIILHCWQDCVVSSIVHAMGAHFSELFHPDDRHTRSSNRERKKQKRKGLTPYQCKVIQLALDLEYCIGMQFSQLKNPHPPEVARMDLAIRRWDMAHGLAPWEPTENPQCTEDMTKPRPREEIPKLFFDAELIWRMKWSLFKRWRDHAKTKSK